MTADGGRSAFLYYHCNIHAAVALNMLSFIYLRQKLTTSSIQNPIYIRGANSENGIIRKYRDGGGSLAC